MPRSRVSGKLELEMTADFETTSPLLKAEYTSLFEQSKFDNVDAEIYSWATTTDILNQEYLPPEKDKCFKYKIWKNRLFTYGIGIDSFFEYISTFKRTFRVSFHNFRAFDGHFILRSIEKFGFNMIPIKIKEAKLQETYGDKYNPSFLRTKLANNEYTLWNDETGKIYEIRLRRALNKKDKSQVILAGSEWLFNGSIAGFGKILRDVAIKQGIMNFQEASDYYEKKELKDSQGQAYLKHSKYKTLKDLENDGNELEYLLQDSFILYEFRKQAETIISKDKWKTTTASTAFQYWKDTLAETYIELGITEGKIKRFTTDSNFDIYYINKWFLNMKPSRKPRSYYQMRNSIYKYFFPLNWSEEEIETENGEMTLHHYINKKWYNGGITYANPRYQNRVMRRRARVADITSSYPTSMYFKKIPYGEAKIGDVEGYNFKLYTIKIKRGLFNSKGLPFVHLKNKTHRKEWLKTLSAGDVINLSSPEFERFKRFYRATPDDYEAVVEFSFKQMTGKLFFGRYIEEWLSKKEQASIEGNDILKYIAKLFLNSLYGKFGMDSVRKKRTWDNINNRWNEQEDEITKPTQYIPVAIAITSESRMKLVDAVGNHFERFVYTDTDSVLWLVNSHNEFAEFQGNITKGKWINGKFVAEGTGIEILGKWEPETEEPSVVFVVRRPKQYAIWFDEPSVNINHKKVKIRIAGLRLKENDIKTITPYEMLEGKIIKNQIRPIYTDSGKLLVNVNKQITPAWSKNFKRGTEQIYYTQQEILVKYKQDNPMERRVYA